MGSSMDERRRYADELRRISFFGITLSTVATIASVVIIPIVYGYIQRVQASLSTELEHCRADNVKMWHEYHVTTQYMGVNHHNRRVKKHYLPSRYDPYAAQPNAGVYNHNQYGSARPVQPAVPKARNYADSDASGSSFVGGKSTTGTTGSSGRGSNGGNAAESPSASPTSTEAPFPKGFRPNPTTKVNSVLDYSGIDENKCCACAMGEPGDSGPQGPPGDDGLDGIPGEDGTPGPDAYPGEKPNHQSWCFDCPEAPAGPSGPAGTKGLPGYPGEPGDDGLDGRVGEPGPPGQSGLPGNIGKPGDKGPRGPPGIVKEIPAPPGRQGPVGPVGDRGHPGNTGKPGKPGRQGIIGYTGDPGHSGSAGRDGADGKPGEPGPPGASDSCSHCPQPRLETGYHA